MPSDAASAETLSGATGATGANAGPAFNAPLASATGATGATGTAPSVPDTTARAYVLMAELADVLGPLMPGAKRKLEYLAGEFRNLSAQKLVS